MLPWCSLTWDSRSLEVLRRICNQKSEMFILMTVCYIWSFSLCMFQSEVRLSRWLFNGRNVSGRNGCLTKSSQATEKRGNKTISMIFLLSKLIENVLSLLQLLKSNKLTNNCSHLWIAQVGAVVSHKFPSKFCRYEIFHSGHMKSYKWWVLAEKWLFL